MKDGVNMAKKINNLTKKYADYPALVGRKMMLRYANQDWDYDVVHYIDETIRCMGRDSKMTREEGAHVLNYWKYIFQLAKGDKEDAMYHLKKSYKEGGPDATAQYAYFYYTGQEITKSENRKKAQKLFSEALSQKSMFAEYLFAEAIMSNDENDLDIMREAIPYYEAALKKGVIFARYKLANCYLKTGTKLEVAEKLFKKCDEPDAKAKIEEVRFARFNDKKKR